DRIAAAARTSGRIVMPCHQYRHNPVWMQVKQWLASGAIGRWHLAEFSVHRTTADPGRMAQGTPWRGTSATGRGGVLIDHGTHLVDQLLDIAGVPTRVSGWTGRPRDAHYEGEGHATAGPFLEDIRRVASVVEHAYVAARSGTTVAIPDGA